MSDAKPVVILGAGPAGLTAAWELTRAGYQVVVWEADPIYVGGISRTVEQEGFHFDIGGHRFFKIPEVNEVWRRIVPSILLIARVSPAFITKANSLIIRWRPLMLFQAGRFGDPSSRR